MKSHVAPLMTPRILTHMTPCSNYVAQIYPAYASYKALRTRSPREIVPWLMYWIVLALFSALESVADVLVFW